MSDHLWDVIAGADLGTLATIKRDGRPQLSDVNYTAVPGLIRFSTMSSLAKVHNLRRDPRASFKVTASSGVGGYAVAEAIAELSASARQIDDDTVIELVDVYRRIVGEHPDWDDYRRAMVNDGRIVVRLHVERVYGWVTG
ncbi:PPOX class F420-dependent oxidoreductase [Nocardia sp. NPDC005998]|uniref:PPOX class F420-dependent oxidoreductase n=1 Tax=Nocardia sp. NPDC005998 TaxID=3156894 RepID=UPI0033B96A28